MSGAATTGLPVDVQRLGGVRVVRLPALVRGRLRMPPAPLVGEIRQAVANPGPVVLGPTPDGAWLIVDPGGTEEEERRVVVVPAVDPRELPEPDPGAALLRLASMPFADALALIDAVGQELVTTAATLLPIVGGQGLAGRAGRAFGAQLPALFSGDAVASMVQRDLGAGGRAALDGWVPIDAPVEPGPTARLAFREAALAPPGGAPQRRPGLRAMPTRQLHLTAGNTPVVAPASLLWGWGTKGAVVLKPAADAVGVGAAIAAAIAGTAGDHPLADHTTIAYWRGGEDTTERPLLAANAFDRRVVWGSQETIDSVLGRGGPTDTVLLRPRVGLSVVGRRALTDDLAATARLAAIDTMVADQRACMSSLLHVVECDDDLAERYAAELAATLGRWDEAWPSRPPAGTRARLVALRRGRLAGCHWHINGEWPTITSAVVVGDTGAVPLAEHPGGRLVLVQPVERAGQATRWLGPDVATVGIHPATLREELAGLVAAHGVDNVLPLGAAEEGWAGRPHDGMRVPSRLVRWVNG